MTYWFGLLAFGALLMACGDEGGGGSAPTDGGGGAGGAPVCMTTPLAEGERATILAADWPGPVVISHENPAGEIAYVSLDADGTLRWILSAYDFAASGTAVWQADSDRVVVSSGAGDLDWPAPPPGLSGVSLERLDDRQVAAHLSATSGDSDELWVAGSLCTDGCEGGPAYPCALDFDALWSLVQPD